MAFNMIALGLAIAIATRWCVEVDAKQLAPAVIVFGDSTVDPGNNNHISTLIRSNFPPYGKDFPGHNPTGRFCNGRLPTDFLAEGLGIKEAVPPYLDPRLKDQDLLTGVSFASAGTGYDNATSRSVIPMWKEVEYFKEYKIKLERIAGIEEANNILNKAIFVVSAGSNDFIENYYVNPFTRSKYTVSKFQDHIIEISSNILQEIYSYGARKIAVAGLPALGCLPLERAVKVFRTKGGCVKDLNQDAIDYNMKLQAMIDSLKSSLPDLRIVYADVYSMLVDMELNPAKYNISYTSLACCGTGSVEFGYACNKRTPFTCSDASKYIFWDSVHPTEKTYKYVAQDLLRNSIPELLDP
ncbi:GDSL esterase/lipase At2g04570 isoform X2 [Cryptomeria japonica]|uniref:GDSL esterase/lipase At2g04570 isoform X2 n=1 Tax=Cryptomeria japonica TaxID=3369 RepID=UPI0025ACC62F|nr:GDSL esterase/lipase At2g04570 isoform X2 [Cryptomeria japonica]